MKQQLKRWNTINVIAMVMFSLMVISTLLVGTFTKSTLGEDACYIIACLSFGALFVSNAKRHEYMT